MFKKKSEMTQEEIEADAVKRAMGILKAANPELADSLVGALAETENQKEITAALEDEHTKQRAEPHFWIELFQTQEDIERGAEPFVFVGAAGVSYQLTKGQRIPVPKSVIEVLNNAEVKGWIPVVDQVRQLKYLKPVKYKRYPFSVSGPASKQEVEAFKASMREQAQKEESIVLGQEALNQLAVQDAIAGDGLMELPQ